MTDLFFFENRFLLSLWFDPMAIKNKKELQQVSGYTELHFQQPLALSTCWGTQ